MIRAGTHQVHAAGTPFTEEKGEKNDANTVCLVPTFRFQHDEKHSDNPTGGLRQEDDEEEDEEQHLCARFVRV